MASGHAGPGLSDAPRGGEFVLRRAEEPYSLNPIVSAGHSATDIQFLVVEPLLVRNAETNAWEPALAHRWRRRGRTFEFELRPDARWSDGRPVTAADVKFSFDVLFDDRFPTAHMRPYYEGVARVETVNARKVRFHTRSSYYLNFLTCAGLPVVPRHVYADPARGPHLHRSLVGSGPYKVEAWEAGSRLVLTKNDDWWGRRDRAARGTYNFDRVVFRFVGNENAALEMLNRGQIDYMALDADTFAKRAVGGALWGRSVFRERVENAFPRRSERVAWNLERPKFADRRVRLALARLFDRRTAVEKFSRGLNRPATGPWSRQSEFADARVHEIEYDPTAALRLLREAGVADKSLSFTILTSSREAERVLSVYQHDARAAGVSVTVRYLEYPALLAAVDRRDFDAVVTGSGGGLVEFDPWIDWHSRAVAPAGQNFGGYRSPAVDRWIDRSRFELAPKRRRDLLRRIYRKIAFDQPALFLYDESAALYAISKRIGRPAPTFRFDVGQKFWWDETARGRIADVSL